MFTQLFTLYLTVYGFFNELKLTLNDSKLKILQDFTQLRVAGFTIKAGDTCPYANLCRAKSIMDYHGNLTLKKCGIFTCYIAKLEVCYKALYRLVVSNLYHTTRRDFIDKMSELIQSKKIRIMRIHVGGDFYNLEYFKKWISIAYLNPQVIFYAYTKNLDIIRYNIERLPGPQDFLLQTFLHPGQQKALQNHWHWQV